MCTFLGPLEKLREANINIVTSVCLFGYLSCMYMCVYVCVYVCMNVCLSTWNKSVPTGRISMKFNFWKVQRDVGATEADSQIACRAHAFPLPCRALIHTCHAAPLPCSDSAVSFVNVRMIAGNIRTASVTDRLFL